jgi:rhodanese-related sulfurtransferase/DNA-binding transcriptional ArsR family regulator
MGTADFEKAVFEQIARLGKAFSSATRLEILALLEQTPRTVQVLADQLGQSAANTSQHLKSLKEARLVESEKDGLHVTYRIADEKVGRTLRMLEELAEDRLLEMKEVVERYFSDHKEVESVEGDELADRIKEGEVTLIDVRPREEYEAAHLPGAVSVPLEELEDRIDELPENREIVAYCRGPYCVMSAEAVETLRERGREALRLKDGVSEWRERGHRVES